MIALKTESLSCIYNKGTFLEKVAVKDVNLSINDGEIVGIIGHTGSGKSTLVQMLNGIIKPTSGRIFLYGKDVWEDYKDRKDVYFKVGLVFQYPEKQLFSQTVYDDIAFGPKNQGLSKDKIKEKVFEAMEFVNLDKKLLNRSPFELSGGEQRRVAIAGVFATSPNVLILDEPTAGLDSISKKNIMENVLKYHKNKNGVVIFISHSMEEVAEISERVIVMDGGSIQLAGSTEDVFYEYEKLRKMDLDVPQITKIMSGIYSMGYDLNKKIVTVDKATKEIIKLLKKKSR